MAQVQIIAIRGGSNIDHRAIIAYKWQRVSDGVIGETEREDMVRQIRNSNGTIIAFVQVGNSRANCETRTTPTGNVSYLETYPDHTQRDNLLSLPQF